MQKPLFTTIARNSLTSCLALIAGLTICGSTPASAEDTSCGSGGKPACVDWKRLTLSAQQQAQVDQLQQDWNAKYMRIQPQILALQQKIKIKFADPKADPVDIMTTQQSLVRLQEDLRNEAMANYLRKRSLLNDSQKRQLESMMQQMVAERQQRNTPKASQAADEQGGLMNIIHKVNRAIEPQH